MIENKKISSVMGSGGGGGKGKGGGDEPSNTLRSKARARIVDLISEGPIEGLVDGGKSIYFDETPVIGLDGTYNIKGVTFSQRLGTPDQTHFTNVPTVDTPVTVEVQVKKNQAAPVRTIADTNADAVRVVMRIPALLKRNKSNGNIEPTSVNYAIDVRASGGTWVEKINQNIVNEKTSSPYQKAHYISLPLNGAPWDIRVRRLTDDSTTTDLQNETWWEAYFILVEGKFIYPNSALVCTEVDAEKFGQQIPQRYYHVKGRKINVPSNYDPLTRIYTGIWNGTFKTAWTNNPAWIFYDLLTHERYGLGEFIDATKVDKWSLYQIAQYCDQLVPSGYKDTSGNDIMEPRFTFNGVINTREEAHTVLQSIINTWRGMAYWSIGQVFATADMPSDPVKLVSPSNVVNGQFSYSGTAMKARHSVAIVQWSDPNDFYRPSYEVVINDDMLQRYGWRETEVTLRGCTSRGTAHRYGKWILDVEQNETETVEYEASWDHADVKPGNILSIADPNKAAVRNGGRIIKTDPNNRSVLLDGKFDPTNLVTYTLTAELPDGSVEGKTITRFIDVVRDSESEIENYISMSGATTGVLGSSGSLPNGWSSTTYAGITKQVMATGNLSDGRPYIDVKISGTNSSGSIATQLVYFNTPNFGPYAITGDTFTLSLGVKRIDGSFVGFNGNNGGIILREYNVATSGSFVSTTMTDTSFPLNSEKNVLLTKTAIDASTTNFVPYCNLLIPAGATVDVTLRFIAPQLEKGSTAHDYVVADTCTRVILSGPFSSTPISGAMWVISGEDINPRQYRVLGISESDTNTFKINALFHDPTKYARVEQDLYLPPPTYYKPPNTIAPPSNLNIQETQYIKDGKTYSRILLSWTPSDDFMAKAYRVSMDTPDGNNVKLGDVSNTSIDIDDIIAGDYVFYVSAVSMSGRVSSASSINYTAAGWTGTTNPFVSDLQIEGQGTNTSFGGNGVRFTWKNNLAGSNQTDTSQENATGTSPFYRDNIVKIYDTATNTLLRTQYITTNNYTYSYDRNYADNLAIGRNPTRSFRIEVAVRDTLGRTSAYVPLSVSNGIPNTPVFAVNASVSSIIVNITKPTDQDFAGVKIWCETNSSFNPNTTTAVYDGPSTSVSVPVNSGTTYYVRVAAYDSFDKLNLNVAPAVSVTTPTFSVDTTPPAVPTGLAMTSDVVVSAAGQEQVKLIITWNANSEDDLAYYGVDVKEATGQYVPFMTSGNRWEGIVRAGVQYTARIKAIDATGNESAYCTAVSHTTVKDTVAPATPTGFAAQAGFKSNWLSWTANTESDLDRYEIYVSSSTTAPVAGTTPTFQSRSTVLEHSGLSAGVTRNYWIRAVDSSGNKSAWSSMITATTVNITSPDVTGAIDMTSFANGIVPPRVVSVLPTLPNSSYPAGSTVVLTTDGKLYRTQTGLANSWTASVAAVDVTGQIVGSQIADGALTIAKFASTIKPIEIVSSLPTLPNSSYPANTYVTLTTDGKLYRSTGSTWVTGVAAADITGTLQAAQIASLAASQVTGQLTSAQIAALEAAKISGQLTSAQIADIAASKITGQLVASQIADAAVTTAKFASNIEPISIVSSLPNPSGYTGSKIVFNQTNGKIYRYSSGAWTSAAPATDIVGQLTSDQIADIAAAKLTGQITSTQIADGGISTPKLAAGAITANKIAANAITANEIAAGAITTNKLSANAVTANEIAANAIVVGKIAAGAVRATEIAANAIVATKLFIGETSNAYPDPEAADDDFYSSSTGTNLYKESTTSSSLGRYYRYIDYSTALASCETSWFSVETSADYIVGGYVWLLANSISGEVANIYAELGTMDNTGSVTPTRRVLVGTKSTTYTGGTRPAVNVTTTSTERRMRVVFEKTAGGSNRAASGGIVVRRRSNSSLIVDGSITSDKIVTNAITTDKIAANAITANEIAAATITGEKIAAATITAANLVANTITADKIAASAITATELAAGAVTTAKLAAGAITASTIASATITGDKIAANTITGDKILANTITASQISAGAIGASEIAAGAILASKLMVSDTSNAYPDFDMMDSNLYSSSTGSSYILAKTGSAGYAAGYLYLPSLSTDQSVETSWFQCENGADYWAEILANLSVAATGAEKATVYISLGSVSSTNVITETRRIQICSVTSNATSRYGTNVTTTSSEKRFRFVMVREGGVGTGLGRFSGPLMRRRSNGNLIVDGSVTSDKIFANAITADKIAANAITSDKIAANAIIAGKVAAGAIAADQIAAGAILASKLLVADTSNVYPDYDMVDADFYNTSTSASYGFGGTSNQYRGKRYLSIQPSASLESVESNWSRCESSCDYWIEGSLNLSVNQTASEVVNLYVEFATMNEAGVLTSTRQVLVGSRSTTTSTRMGVAVTTSTYERAFRFVFERTAGGTSVAFFGGPVVRRKANGSLIVDGSIASNHLVTNTAVITGTAQIADAIISTAKISDLSVTNAKIANATIDSAKISSITSDKIVVSGSTTLADWRLGSGTTIDGGKIAANTIVANSLTIGLRGIEVESIEFEHNSPSTNQVSWSAGTIRYTNDAGTVTSSAITASNATWSTGVLYIYWTKASTTLSSTTSAVTAFSSNNVVLAVYKGNTDLVTDYGRVIIDGGKIKANTITAAQITAGAIGATEIAANSISATHIVASTITGAKIAANTITASNIAASTITADKIAVGDFTNIVTNGNFISGNSAGWSSLPTAATVVLASSLSGAPASAPTQYVLQFVRPDGTTRSIDGNQTYAPCAPNDNFFVSCSAISSATITQTNKVRLIAVWLLNTGSTALTSYYFNPTTSWSSFSTSFVAPANSIGFKMRIAFDATTTETSTIYMTNFVAKNMINGGVLIQDGTISASKLSVVSLDAISASFGTITAGKAQSTDGKMTVDLDNKRILIGD